MNEAVYDPRFLNSKGPNAFDLLCFQPIEDGKKRDCKGEAMSKS
jgi:hypothetical protein